MKKIRLELGPSLEIATIAIFILVLVSNLIVIQFAKGYFDYYGVPLDLVNFTPQMYDYIRITLPALLSTVVIMGFAFALLKFDVFISEKAADKFIKHTGYRWMHFVRKYDKLFRKLSAVLGIIFNLIIFTLYVYILWTFAIIAIPNAGEGSARMQGQFMSISEPSSIHQDVIIYRGNDGLLLKTYDTKTKEFEPGYRFQSNIGYKTSPFTID